MRTIWTGTELVLSFHDGTEFRLNREQTQEFEDWVKGRVALIQRNTWR